MSAARVIRGAGQTLVLTLPERGQPRIAAWGAFVLPSETAFRALGDLMARSSRINGMDENVPAAVLLPTGGMGFFGAPAIAGHRGGRDFLMEFSEWTERETKPGRTVLVGRDLVAELSLIIEIDASGSVLSMRATLVNDGADDFVLDRCMAGSLLVDADHDEVLTFEGGWGREFHARRERLGSGLFIKENRRGRTSHDRFPAIILGRPGFGELSGPVAGLTLGWSGNHQIIVDRLDDGRRIVHAGELFEPGEFVLAAGEAYTSPLVYIGFGRDLDALAARFRDHARTKILTWPGIGPRPVTLNTWEGTYFAHDLANLKAQADAAAAIGIERFVLDDGWFGRRDDDTTSLGDWWVDPRKYPNGLGALVDHVTGLGMEFGLWVEPEMVNPVSDLFRAHPDWALQLPGRALLPSRNQVVLDLTRAEVTDYLFGRIDAILSAHRISYLKWDMNRDLTAVGDASGRAATGGQVRAFYALVDRIREAHPHVEIESCASGGGRADWGALARTHRVWTSDCTDALERLEIQRGAALFLPPEVMGAHISASPNHQTARRHSLDFRAIVALPYHLGVEMSPLALNADERSALSAWIALHKRLRPLFHGGRAFRLPDRDGRHVHGVAARGTIVLIVAQASHPLLEHPAPIRLPGDIVDLFGGELARLALPAPQVPPFVRIHEAQARLLRGEVAVPAALIATVGITVPQMLPESAVIIEITRSAEG